ncbi:uncharacterized protein [Erythrolamprus reginae]|uniref:uncharacterized protein n=1 Tax=Erythrolamprus reginae TaxID=121349 RepID=UPI00396C55CE
MDNRGIGFGQYQFLRTKSSVPSPVGLCPPSRRQTHTYLNRQCSNQGPPESSGGHEVPTSYGGNYEALHLGRDPFGVTDRGTYRRDQQLHSGLAQQGYPGSVRVATRSRPVLPVDPEVWGPPSGPICQRPEHSASEVFHTVSGSRSRGDQRPTVTLASRSPVRISPRESHPEGGGKDPSRGGGSDLTSAILATSPVVRGLGGTFSVTPVEDSRSDHLVEPGESETPRSSVATLDRKGLGLSAKSISRWIKDCISEAYKAGGHTVPEGLTAHSTRSAATSAAWSTQASIEDICRAATWAAPTTFIRHYKLDSFASAEAAFGRRVLQRVCVSPKSLVRPSPSHGL